MLNRKVLSFIELIFIIFSTNSLNLRKYHNPTDTFDLFFYSTAIISMIILNISYTILSVKKKFPIEKKLIITVVCISTLILGVYTYNLNKYDFTSPIYSIYITIIILLVLKVIIYSFHLFTFLKVKNK